MRGGGDDNVFCKTPLNLVGLCTAGSNEASKCVVWGSESCWWGGGIWGVCVRACCMCMCFVCVCVCARLLVQVCIHDL